MRPHGGLWMTSAEVVSDAHNTSQDSGLGPSPFLMQNGFPRSSPQSGVRPSSVGPSPPPPLPPKKKSSSPSNVFSPTLMVKTPSYGNYYNNSTEQPTNFYQNQPRVPSMECIRTQDFIPSSAQNSSMTQAVIDHNNVPKTSLKKHQHRHRVEAHRNSILIFSSDEDEDAHKNQENNQVIMNEPFPPELDFAQITGHSEFRPHMPPPPPPRDPKRRLYLSGSPVCQVHNNRPVSYSFEKPDVVQTRTPIQARPRSSSAFVAQAHVYPSHRVLETPPPLRSRSVINESKQGRDPRAASASSYFRYSVPDLVQPQMEYWKSPPPPFVPTFDPNLTREADDSDLPPPRPPRPNLRKKLSNTSNDSRGRDSAIGPSHGPSPISHHHGKSSPSSSSVASKDSGIPEIAISSSLPHQMPTLLETKQNCNFYQNGHHPTFNEEVIDTQATEEEVEVIECSEEEEESTESFSPPRTNENHPGFSSKTRRSLFRAAINEIEDAFKQLQADTDLLDRAERRDLPTVHQELIAQSRSNTSLNTSTEMIFSDMDNFMNWNTSSSFENIPEGRQRTPSARRSGVPDKTKDDMVYRICRDNNKIGGREDPGVKMNQSYLLLSPAMTPASSMANVPSIDYFGNLEPNIHSDDAHYRAVRDSQGSKVSDPEPPFGIPKTKCISGASEKDYLHAVPDPNRYRSTFNASKKPDTVLDDLAYRALRKDDNPSNPASLGIIKDPNASQHSCWKHKMESQLMKPEPKSTFPAVFYPYRNPKLLKVLAEDIRNVIRKQSATRMGGKENNVVTYEDLLKDPNVMATMKEALEIEDNPENDLINGKPWAGKTLYELFKSEMDTHKLSNDDHETENEKSSADNSMMTTSPSPPPLSQPEQVLTVQHLVIEQDPPILEQPPILPPFGSDLLRTDQNNNENKDKDQIWISQTLVQDHTSSHLRTLQRCDSDTDTDIADVQCPDVQRPVSNTVQDVEAAKDEGTNMCVLMAWLDHPGVLALFYCLALLQQIGHLGGLDFLSLLGIVLATISMMTMFFL